jgi:hypothetical protein
MAPGSDVLGIIMDDLLDRRPIVLNPACFVFGSSDMEMFAAAV